MGACFIEKHFTLNKNLPGPDHRFSADPNEFQQLVKGIRMTEMAMGSADIGPTKSESYGRSIFRLSCVLRDDLKAGTLLEPHHVVFLRPGTGIPPKEGNELYGRTIKRDLLKGHIFTWDDLK